MDIINFAKGVLGDLQRLQSTYIRLSRLKKSMENTLTLLIEFLNCRVHTPDIIDNEFKTKIMHNLDGIQKIVTKLSEERPRKRCAKLLACLSGAGGAFFGARKELEALEDLDLELQTLLQFVRLELMANQNDILVRFAGIYDDVESETPKQFWYRMFRDRMVVPTKVFSNAVQSRTKCNNDIAYYLACTFSTDGNVHSETFLGSFEDPSKNFKIAEWLQNILINENARTVSIPGHVKRITEMRIFGNYLISSSYDCTLKVFELYNKTIILKNVMIGHEQAVKSFVYLPEKNYIISASKDKTLRYWNFANGELLTTVELPDTPYKLCRWGSSEDVVIYVTKDTAYPIVFFDIARKNIINKIRTNPSITAIESAGDQIRVCDSNSIRIYNYNGDQIRHIGIDSYVRISTVSNGRIMYETKQGFCIVDSTGEGPGDSQIAVKIIENPSLYFSVTKIREFGELVYVLWSYGPIKKQSNLTIYNMETKELINHELNFMKESFCTDLIVKDNIAYCATYRGNIYWYDVSNSTSDKCDGHTYNDQMILGSGFTNVKIVTFGSCILVINKDEARIYNTVKTEIRDIKFPFVIMDCVYLNGNFIMIDSNSVYWYNEDFDLINTMKTSWQLEKIAISNECVLFLYLDLQRYSEDCFEYYSTKNLALYREGKFDSIKMHANGILFSTPHRIYLSHQDNIVVTKASDLDVEFTIGFHPHAKGIAISGCIIDEKIYTLHSCNNILVWISSFSEITIYKTVKVHDSIVEIREFNRHILGFSTLGTIYVYDTSMELKKCIVSHSAKTIFGTSYKDNKEVIVTDHNGVTKILAELFTGGNAASSSAHMHTNIMQEE